MPEIKPSALRACPVCRVTMLPRDFGWSCPQCGSAIKVEPRNETEQAASEAPSALRG